MALTPLATVADLQSKGIDVSESDKVMSFLKAASDEVRSAARVPILRATYTVDLAGVSEQWLKLPGQPIVTVGTVLLDGTAVTDWKLVTGDLWRASGWLANPAEPCEVTVTITGGLLESPAGVVDLVCSMVGMALGEAEGGGYASRGDLVGVRIDDASEQYASPSIEGRTAGVMELPDATRRRLAARFGGGASVLRMR